MKKIVHNNSIQFFNSIEVASPLENVQIYQALGFSRQHYCNFRRGRKRVTLKTMEHIGSKLRDIKISKEKFQKICRATILKNLP